MVPSEQDVLNHFRDINDTADIGSMAYNIPWAMPDRGFDLTSRVLERFCELPNAVGVKWSSNNIYPYLRMLRWFGHRLKFIDRSAAGHGPSRAAKLRGRHLAEQQRHRHPGIRGVEPRHDRRPGSPS